MARHLHDTTALVAAFCIAGILWACHNTNTGDASHVQNDSIKKSTTAFNAPSTYHDTLQINSPSAIFYYPDSLQLLKIRALTDSMVYNGLVHEYFFQMRNAHMVIKKTWPALKIIDSKNYRYLQFIKTNGEKECIDLDKKKEAYGLFVFDSKKSARSIDMSNVETGISFYLRE